MTALVILSSRIMTLFKNENLEFILSLVVRNQVGSREVYVKVEIYDKQLLQIVLSAECGDDAGAHLKLVADLST